MAQFCPELVSAHQFERLTCINRDVSEGSPLSITEDVHHQIFVNQRLELCTLLCDGQTSRCPAVVHDAPDEQEETTTTYTPVSTIHRSVVTA